MLASKQSPKSMWSSLPLCSRLAGKAVSSSEANTVKFITFLLFCFFAHLTDDLKEPDRCLTVNDLTQFPRLSLGWEGHLPTLPCLFTSTPVPIKHEVGRVPVTQAKDISDHGHDGSRSRVGCSAVKPDLAAAALEPQDLICQRVKGGRRRHEAGRVR
jgi:hypothetical protein